MNILKKLTFAPFYLASFAFLISQTNQILKTSAANFVSFDSSSYLPLLLLAAAILLTSFFLCLLVTLAQDWKIIASLLLVSNVSFFVFFGAPFNLILAVGFLSISALIYVVLDNKLKTYLNFQPASLLSSLIVNFSRLVVVLLSLVYFLQLSATFDPKSFTIPDSLLDSILSITGGSQAIPEIPSQTSLPKSQLDELKKNPQLLRQFGLSPEVLDNLDPTSLNNAAENSLNTGMKEALKIQFDNMIAPYKQFLPIGLSVLLFISLTSLVSFLSLGVAPLVWFIFFILEKTGFTRYQTEMREVRKLVVS